MKYLNKVYRNRDAIVEALADDDRYYTSQQDEETVLFNKGREGDAFSMETTIILIDGGIWQYKFYNPEVREDSRYVTAQEFLRDIIIDADIDI